MGDCVPCGGRRRQVGSRTPTDDDPQPSARWQVTYPNGQVVLYLNREQAARDAARKGGTVAPWPNP